jgi:hypothetical protein
VDSLKRNAPSIKSDLYVVSDASHSASQKSRVNEVREYVRRIEGFQRVNPIFREKNYGSFRSVKEALDDILKRHGCVIFLEDDNIVSTNFLSFLNDGLGLYREDRTVFSISAYAYPVKIPASYRHNVYRWRGFSAWGVGLWEDRWSSVRWSYDGFDAFGPPQKHALSEMGEHLPRYIAYDIAHNRMIIDTVISFHMFKQQCDSIFPILTKVQNIGHDGSGEHGGSTDRYLKQVLDPGLPYRLDPNIQTDERINLVLRRYFKTPLKAKAVMAISPLMPRRTKKWLKERIRRRISK